MSEVNKAQRRNPVIPTNKINPADEAGFILLNAKCSDTNQREAGFEREVGENKC